MLSSVFPAHLRRATSAQFEREVSSIPGKPNWEDLGEATSKNHRKSLYLEVKYGFP